jgi:hypothetical protein
MSDGQTFRVLADYEVNDPHPLRLQAGAPVKVLRADLGWPGWLWIEAGDQTGWIPESFLRGVGSDNPVTARAFDGADLSARRGDALRALEEAPGWIYAEGGAGRRGWFPLFNLRPLPRT